MTHLKPSVDLGYPTPVHGRIPSFNNIEEEAEFWDTHSFSEFDEELTPVEVTVSKNLSAPLSVRLDPQDRAAIVRQLHAIGRVLATWPTTKVHWPARGQYSPGERACGAICLVGSSSGDSSVS